MKPSPAARLFEVPLEEFTAARNALVKELRKSGDEEEAKAVAALRKPSKALWLVNQLTRRAPKELQALIEATERIREAQEKGLTGDEVREGMREQRAALQALIATAEAAAGGAGFARDGRSAYARSIGDTLQAAALAEADALREGRLLQELAPAGFGALLGAELQPLKPPPPKKAEKHEKHSAAKDSGADAKEAAKAAAAKEAERAAAEKEAAKLDAHADSLEAAATKAEHTAKEAASEAEKAARAAEKASEVFARATESATKAREEAKSARTAAIDAKNQLKKLGEA